MGEWPQANKGIVIGGNAKVSGVMAAGDHAVARGEVRDGGTEEAAEALRVALAAIAELRRRLEEMERTADAALAGPYRQVAAEEAAALEGELAAEDTDPEQVTGRLTRLQALVGGVTALGGLVTAAQQALQPLLG